jgi:phosphoribosylformimino-5-aminoimidazole carboxamide ribotide isomerase
MILFPAIDLKNNMCVRLEQGNMSSSKIYQENPLIAAKNFESMGTKYLHIVDLDKAVYKVSENIKSIKEITENTSAFIQVGGGIQSIDDVKNLIECGVNRVIIGSVAVNNFELLKEMVNLYGNKIIVSIDAKNGMVATHGWQEISTINALDLCLKLESIGVETIVYTDISKDGMLMGPNFDDYKRLLNHTNLKIIASGGISSLNDLIKLNEMNLHGAIIGKALYENRFSLKEAIECLQNESSLV